MATNYSTKAINEAKTLKAIEEAICALECLGTHNLAVEQLLKEWTSNRFRYVRLFGRDFYQVLKESE